MERDKGMKQHVENGCGRQALRILGGCARWTVLADIEIEGLQIVLRKIGEQAQIAVELVFLRRVAQIGVEPAEQIEHVTLQLGHLAHVDPLGIGEAVERAEQVAEGVAQLAIRVRGDRKSTRLNSSN